MAELKDGPVLVVDGIIFEWAPKFDGLIGWRNGTTGVHWWCFPGRQFAVWKPGVNGVAICKTSDEAEATACQFVKDLR